ncbi:MAG TPA: MBL fold metallo-hydrolase [Burkholderiaceae bacterium]|jgi:glyoxylase-like metal-dependent hydrolase (beta-lactamase superfamily II)
MIRWRWVRMGCAIALSWQAAALAQPRVLEPGVEWLPGRLATGTPPDGNSVLIEAPDGWIVVDTGRSPAHAQALMDRIRASGKPLRVIVNTHWHLDHIGGNRTLRTAFPPATVIASDAIAAARSGFLATHRRQLLDEMAKRPPDDVQRLAWQRDIDTIDDVAASTPDRVISERDTIGLAGLGLSIGVQRLAATAGDVWVYEPTSQVLAAGDLVTLPAPLFDTACPEGWAAALQQVSTIRFRWLVPGHGEPLSRGQFVIYRESFDRLLRCAASDAPKQQCIDGWLRDAGGLFARDQQPLARTLLSHHLDHSLRAPRGAQCQP